MKPKRSKTQLNELGNKLQNEASTRNGVNADRDSKSNVNVSDCASGVCSIVWKPEALKRYN